MTNIDELKSTGLKATLPRLKIREIFQKGTQRHMTAEDVFRVLLDERTVTRRRAEHEDPTADLTPSELRVVDLIGEGLSNREIAERLSVAEKTVKNHITSLLAKMGLQRRTQVAAWVAGQRAAAWRN